MWRLIATWMMAQTGFEVVDEDLRANKLTAGDAVSRCIQAIEDYPYYKSVGYGGLPNEDGEVELDAGYMSGKTLDIGAVCAVKTYKNPIKLAQQLAKLPYNNFLAGLGADQFAKELGCPRQNLLTERAKHYYERKKAQQKQPEVYKGHDTVGVCCLDHQGDLVAATSTSGLFLKKAGRVGDSPLVGSGFYAEDGIGAASATGVGEDIMRGLVSYEIVRKMRSGSSVQAACEETLAEVAKRFQVAGRPCRDISVVALDAAGNYGVATNIHNFSFVTASEDEAPEVYICQAVDGKMQIEKASSAFKEAYMAKRLTKEIQD